MHWFTQLFLSLAAITTLFRIWLDWRHIGHVLAHRGKVPAPFDGSVSLADHQKAADYTAANNRLGILDTVLDTVILLLWTLGGGLALLGSFWDNLGWGPIATGTAVIVSLLVISSVLSLPLSLYKTFNLEARFGFNRTTPKLFLVDLLKGFVLTLVLGAPLVAVILWIMDAAGERWWFYAWAVWTAFTLFITWAYPAFIAPLFNEFSPLEKESLKTRIEDLLSRCGFTSNGIFVMDGSKRSSHGNAYFTGLGNNKRIVFFDTLIETLEEDEIEAVLAHELGHFKKNHVKKRLIFVFLFSLLGLGLLGYLKEQPWFFSALGVEPSNHMALILFMLVVPLFTLPFTPISSYFSRRHEFEADEYAARQSDAVKLITALVKLYRDNATTLTPDPMHSAFYDSHPPAPVRVHHLSSLAKIT